MDFSALRMYSSLWLCGAKNISGRYLIYTTRDVVYHFWNINIKITHMSTNVSFAAYFMALLWWTIPIVHHFLQHRSRDLAMMFLSSLRSAICWMLQHAPWARRIPTFYQKLHVALCHVFLLILNLSPTLFRIQTMQHNHSSPGSDSWHAEAFSIF
jgi:hypothetical protein